MIDFATGIFVGVVIACTVTIIILRKAIKKMEETGEIDDAF